MFRRHIFFSFLIFVIICSVYAQSSQKIRPTKIKPQISWKDSLYYGGNLGVQFYGNGSLFDLSPNAGFKFNKYLSVGLQGIFTNLTVRDVNFVYKYTFYGLGSFVRIKPLPYLFLQAEYDVLSVPDNFSTGKTSRTIADVNLAGLGIRNDLGSNICYYLLIMYEFVPTPNSPYTNGPFRSPRVLRAGFNFNF
jgi:hypothetical protein